MPTQSESRVQHIFGRFCPVEFCVTARRAIDQHIWSTIDGVLTFKLNDSIFEVHDVEKGKIRIGRTCGMAETRRYVRCGKRSGVDFPTHSLHAHGNDMGWEAATIRKIILRERAQWTEARERGSASTKQYLRADGSAITRTHTRPTIL